MTTTESAILGGVEFGRGYKKRPLYAHLAPVA
jgi:hypothetical protein